MLTYSPSTQISCYNFFNQRAVFDSDVSIEGRSAQLVEYLSMVFMLFYNAALEPLIVWCLMNGANFCAESSTVLIKAVYKLIKMLTQLAYLK